MLREKPILYIVIPCYNEEEVLPVTAPMFKAKIESLVASGLIDDGSRILFVNDGSRDRTWEVLTELCASDPVFTAIKLSRNRGHQNALLAGLMEAKDLADITISIDCDGQDDIDAMDEMVRAYNDGCEIVYGVRSDRSSDSFFKRSTAQGYYKILNALGGEVIYNHADYRLVSSRVLNELANYKEVNLFLRGMFPMIGFKSTCVEYSRHERLAGKSKYPLSKMLTLAFDGITSFSVKPIRIITGLGALTVVLSLVLIIYALVSWATGHVVPGWSSSFIGTTLIGGIQLISLGVIGEYVGKIYMETKGRPRYIVEERTWSNTDGGESGEKM
ncbi:MAG: glycosyltransferase family 2 protein [Lachnospiraceae bacterium]|nr:glycosyltransferase family 2 protein [Lachnospiraceae bacterium]